MMQLLIQAKKMMEVLFQAKKMMQKSGNTKTPSVSTLISSLALPFRLGLYCVYPIHQSDTHAFCTQTFQLCTVSLNARTFRRASSIPRTVSTIQNEMSNRDPDNLMTTNDESFDYLFKIVLIGDCGTGKTCFVQRFRFGTFNETHGSTIGVDFSMKTVLIDDKKVKLQIWDTAGQERFRTIRQSYYRSANGVIVVYDITKRSTFLSLQHWVEEVRRYTSSHVLLVLVGNRCDLEHLREVEKEEAEALRQYLPEVLQVVETSAKENTNIDFVFFYLASELKRRHENRQISTKEDEVVRLGSGRKLSSCSGCSYKIF